MDEYLSIKEFATVLKVHPNTVRNAIKSGKLQVVRIGAGQRASYRIARSEINRVALFDLREMMEKIVTEKLKENF